jgi:hypothetical protein
MYPFASSSLWSSPWYSTHSDTTDIHPFLGQDGRRDHSFGHPLLIDLIDEGRCIIDGTYLDDRSFGCPLISDDGRYIIGGDSLLDDRSFDHPPLSQ